MRGEGNCVTVKFLGSNHHLLLPAQWAHMTSGTRAAGKHGTFSLQQGKPVGLFVTSFAGKQTLHAYMHTDVCTHIINTHVYIYVCTQAGPRVDMHSSHLVCKNEKSSFLVETATMTLKDLAVYSGTDAKPEKLNCSV